MVISQERVNFLNHLPPNSFFFWILKRKVLAVDPQKIEPPQPLTSPGQLFEDDDGHVAHEFLEECAEGLRISCHGLRMAK